MHIQFNINIDDGIIAFIKKIFIGKWSAVILSVAVSIASAILFAATTVSKPHTFEPGTLISAGEVNENFDVLYQKVNELAQNVQAVPAGTIVSFAGPEDRVPEGWLLCDGRLFESTDPAYSELFRAIGTYWGSSGTQFRIPDLRGEFLRGVDAGRNRDPDAGQRKNYDGTVVGGLVGSCQEDAFESHIHYMNRPFDIQAESGSGGVKWHGGPIADQTGIPKTGNVSSETRPINAAVNFIIKY